MASGIYAIINTHTGHWYVGQSQNIRKRRVAHLSSLRKGKHENSRLQRAWTKYGEDAFAFEALILAPVYLLNDLEQAYLDDPETSELNIARCAEVPARGLRHTPEAKAKIGEASRNMSPDHRAKISAAHKGRKLSSEHKAKLKGRKRSPETRERIRMAATGRKMSAEAIAKMVASKKGYRATPETKAKQSAALKGRQITEEHKAKIAVTRRARGSWGPKKETD